MAISVMDTLRYDLGVDVPNEVSVVGYDDVPTAAWKAYDLTTVRQPSNRMVSETVRILLNKINNSKSAAPERLEITGPLIVRGSARIPKGWNS